METKIKAAGYIRVSSKDQVDGESLATQRESIKSFVQKNDYELTEMYADEGISGGSIKDRHALLRCMEDGQAGKFKILIVHRLSRFGRNSLELLNNYNELKKVDIELRSISEGIDFSSTYGEFMLTMLAAIAALDRDIIRETTLENRIARGKRGIPTSGTLPYGRIYNKETGQWKLKNGIEERINWVATEYLKGTSLFDLASSLEMSYVNLIDTLSKSCGDKWTVTFKGTEPIVYNVPRILSDNMIQKVKERLAFNRSNNRTDVIGKYLLAGFIRCDGCDGSITGQTLKNNAGEGTYTYYRHKRNKITTCNVFNYAPTKTLERAIFETIFENFADLPNFEKAIADSLPDENRITDLKNKIAENKKAIRNIERDLNKLVDALLKGTLKKETLTRREAELMQAKKMINEKVKADMDLLSSMPDSDSMKMEAEQIRRLIIDKFSSKEHLHQMSFDDKRNLLHWLFDGKDQTGERYGIYLTSRGYGKEKRVDYYMFGRITGLRTLKGDDINFMGDVDDELRKEEQNNDTNVFKNNKVGYLKS